MDNLFSKFKRTPVIGYFAEKSFLHYVWIGGIYSLLNIALLYLFIDILKIPTIISSAIVILGTFILRYVLFKAFKVM